MKYPSEIDKANNITKRQEYIMSVHGAYRRTGKVCMAFIAEWPPRSFQKHPLPSRWLEVSLDSYNDHRDTGKYLANPASRTPGYESKRPMVEDHRGSPIKCSFA